LAVFEYVERGKIMRKEYTEYIAGLPLNIAFANIMEYPIHWHDSIEILFVLKGTIDLKMETETYNVEEREIEIINSNEVHSLKSKDKDNRVLIFNIDPNFFEKYYKDAKDVFFYTNSSIEGIQEDENYYILRKYLAMLLCEIVQKHDAYEDIVEEKLLDMMFHLLNNFHYLFYEEESLREDEVQLERYHRIVKYISNNYMNKVSLQDIAKKEFLSSQYLSYKIKSTFGRSFNDFLNLIRVEESTKLLLDTDKTISEISEEVGFSHVRYYNKHFKTNYKLTPMQYRKKYKMDSEKLEKMKKIKFYDLEEALSIVSHYLEDYNRFNYESKTIRLDIDLFEELEPWDVEIENIVDLGQVKNLLKEENKRLIEEIQKEIGFKYGLLHGIFEESLYSYLKDTSGLINWRETQRAISFLMKQEFIPVIDMGMKYSREEMSFVLEEFFHYFMNYYGEEIVCSWKYFIPSNMSEEYIKKLEEILDENWKRDMVIESEEIKTFQDFNTVYDTSYMIPYIIYNLIEKKNLTVFKVVDEVDYRVKMDNEIFFGDSGLVTNNYIKKSSYYAYFLLSQLGNNLVSKGEEYIVTEKDGDYQILLFSHSENLDFIPAYEEAFLNRGLKNTIERKFSINIKNMEDDYRVIKYYINNKCGCAYDKWNSIGRPKRIDKKELEILRDSSRPKILLSYGKKSAVHNIVATVEEYGGTLIILKKVHK
jgi:AraC-like DNA-binding protein